MADRSYFQIERTERNGRSARYFNVRFERNAYTQSLGLGFLLENLLPAKCETLEKLDPVYREKARIKSYDSYKRVYSGDEALYMARLMNREPTAEEAAHAKHMIFETMRAMGYTDLASSEGMQAFRDYIAGWSEEVKERSVRNLDVRRALKGAAKFLKFMHCHPELAEEFRLKGHANLDASVSAQAEKAPAPTRSGYEKVRGPSASFAPL